MRLHLYIENFNQDKLGSFHKLLPTMGRKNHKMQTQHYQASRTAGRIKQLLFEIVQFLHEKQRQ